MSQARPIDQRPKTLFSHFPHMVDEFEAPRQQDNVDRAESRAAQMRVRSAVLRNITLDHVMLRWI